ncbi:hypothetical protein BDY19DRAFT_414503 [Irpex rosettiformis]|uniref:Uncharacterized protein n=1 Tax=Irpex rosettiformis TaxID=378272 RepID=A0ACB8UFK3_9APHY|nr:hypothetical protein BDY19DRAFT_414503 [Irpex rosettiformis]
MHRATYSTSSTSSSHKSRRLRYSREQLLERLEILGTLSTQIPSELPLSPPASRSNSPTPGSKRKFDAHNEHSISKKPRTSSISDNHRMPSSSSYPIAGPSNYACEDGELREDLPASRRAADISDVPVRRPRRGTKLPTLFFDELYDKYHAYGRMLKYSGDRRLLSTFPPKNSAYQALPDPPSPQSPYHKYGNLIARLELLDALVDFVYAIWAKDYSRQKCSRGNWSNIEAYLVYCKRKWQLEDGADEREKALSGLIWMIEGFIHGRQKLYAIHRDEMEREAAKKEAEAATPPMLPSPASITTSNSANSTPTGRPSAAPVAAKNLAESSSSSLSSSSNPQLQGEHKKLPDPPPPSHINVPVNWNFIAPRKYQSSALVAAAWCMSQAQNTITLPMMAKQFPRTFQRMVHSTFSALDEHEPDIEDDDGELFWPGQVVTGTGIGWVCTMAKAMIKEFGDEFGYRGIDGIIPKPDSEGAEGDVITPADEVPVQAATPVPFQEPADAPNAIQR